MLLVDKVTTPRGMKRSDKAQELIDQQASNLTLYHFKTCPFCIKVNRHNKRLSLKIETRDAQHNAIHREELLQGGGKIKVPCLKIVDENGKDSWLYESNIIVQYLENRFATEAMH